ncbi:MAG: cache domain-containing protein, partial [Alphaproteobacteria bacterium]|nr:cache domain-containing protein [Alphaproteobacteria bacterium]
MRRKLKLTVGLRIYAIIALSFLGLLGVTYFEQRQLGAGLEDQKRLELKHLAEVAMRIVTEEHAAAKAGTVSEDEAKKRAAARISVLRYGNDDYFWINDMHPRMVMHPFKKELNGQDLSQNKDPNGKLLFVEFVNAVKRGGSGYVDYDWPKPGKEKPQPKLSYVEGYAPWGWVIGTGVYIDDLQAQVWSTARQALIITLLIALLIGIVSVYVARRMAGAIGGMTGAMKELAAGNFDVALPGLARNDEIGDMARAIEAFKVRAVEKARGEAEQEEAKAREAAAARRAEMRKLAEEFESAVGNVVNSVSSASGEIETAATSLTQTAETTKELSGSVASASELASSNVQSVASA